MGKRVETWHGDGHSGERKGRHDCLEMSLNFILHITYDMVGFVEYSQALSRDHGDGIKSLLPFSTMVLVGLGINLCKV